jgi:hypothetical protein
MAVDTEVKASKDVVPIDGDTADVTTSVDNLVIELDIITDALMSQDKLLKRATRERKEFKDKIEIMLKELEEGKKLAIVVSDEVECNECVVHMSNLTGLQSKYVALLDENNLLKSRSGLLGACKSSSGLQSKLAEKNTKIFALEKASSGSTDVAKCACCERLVLELESCRPDKMRTEEDNTYLRSILN